MYLSSKMKGEILFRILSKISYEKNLPPSTVLAQVNF